MLSFSRIVLIMGLSLGAPGLCQAEPLTILPDSLTSNRAEITMVGNDNVLTILQEVPLSAPAANSIRVRVSGDRNGGPVGSSFRGAALSSGLMPGVMMQWGSENRIDLMVDGSDNLFAVSQAGTANQLVASIVGNGNQSTVQQLGTGNIAAFSQTGNGNIVSITQTSW